MAKKIPALTGRRREVLLAVHQAISTNGYPPSVREIAEKVGLNSPSSVKHQLDILTRDGYLRRCPARPRALEVIRDADGNDLLNSAQLAGKPISGINQSDNSSVLPKSIAVLPIGASDAAKNTQIPLVGRIAAGTPITAQQQIEEIYELPVSLTGHGKLFMLEVHGDSMIEAAICDGDRVVVRRQNVAEEGEIVAALIDDEATVKVLSRREGHIWLLPRNSNYPPILGDYATIIGKVVTVLRSL